MTYLSPIFPASAKNLRVQKALRYNSHRKLRSRIRMHSGSNSDSIDDLKTFVPEWLTTNKDFVISYKKMKHQVDIDLVSVCRHSHASRTKDEKKALLSWIKGKQYFLSMDKVIVKKACDKLSSANFATGETSK